MPRRGVELRAGEYYHLYNRGNNRGPIFFERESYLFFLRRVRRYLLPVLDVLAYCLMPTHYHFLAHIKSQTHQTTEVAQTGLEGLQQEFSPTSRAMMRFSVSYTKAINNRYDRVGSLFQGAFQAKWIDSVTYLTHLSRYIHLNPVLAGYGAAPEEWEFSSYPEYIGLREGTLPKPESVLAHFPSKEAYRQFIESYASDDRETVTHLLFA
jgi:putative transposase